MEHIEGVIVHAQEVIETVKLHWAILAGVMAAVAIAGFFIMFYAYNHVSKDSLMFLGAIMLVVGLIGGLVFVVLLNFDLAPTTDYYYWVTIDDTVSYKEFEYTYEIVERIDNLYKVRFR